MSFKHFIPITMLLSILSANDYAIKNQYIAEMYQSLTGIESDISLSKRNRTCLTSYENSDFNMHYEAPAGWSFNEPLVGPLGILIYPMSLSYDAEVYVWALKRDSAVADIYPDYALYQSIHNAYSNSSTSPIIYYNFDSDTMEVSLRAVTVEIQYGQTYSYTLCTHVNQYDQYIHQVDIFAATDDYEANWREYWDHLNNLSFLSMTLAKNISNKNMPNSKIVINGEYVELTMDAMNDIKFDMFDMRGKKVKNIYSGILSGKKIFNMKNITRSNQIYLLKLKTNDISESVKFPSLE